MVVDNLQHGEIVPEADLIVMYVMCRGNLKAAGTEVHLHVIVLNHGDFAVDKRNKYLLTL